jgi:alpha-1,6-mannosyltransferase
VLVVLLVLIWLGAAKALDRRGLADDVAAREDAARVVRGIGWAMLAVVVLAPVFLPWYYLWALPVLAVSSAPLWQRADGPLAVVASVLCFTTLPEGYSLGLTTTVVGVPIVLVATVLLLRQGWRTARRIDWRHLADLSSPLLPRPSETSGQIRVR